MNTSASHEKVFPNWFLMKNVIPIWVGHNKYLLKIECLFTVIFNYLKIKIWSCSFNCWKQLYTRVISERTRKTSLSIPVTKPSMLVLVTAEMNLYE